MSPTIDGEITFPELFKTCGVGSTANTLPPSRYTLVFDKDGDLLIEVNDGDGQGSWEDDNEEMPAAGDSDSKATDLEWTYRFRVCSRAMRRASAPWNAMLSGRWREGKPADGGEWVVSFDEDQPLPMAILLAIIHGRPDLVPTWNADTRGAREAISGILSTADKYDVVHLLRPFVSFFIPHTEIGSNLIRADNRGTMHTLNIAWHLGAVKLVKTFLRRILFVASKDELDELLAYALGGPDIGITLELWELLSAVRTQREAAIQYLLDYFHGEVKRHDNNHPEGGCELKKDVLEGLRTKLKYQSHRAPFLGPVAVKELEQFHKLQRRQCDALIAAQILDRLKKRNGKETSIPRKAKEVGKPAGVFITDIEYALNFYYDDPHWNPEPVFLCGHDQCVRAVDREFDRFKSGDEYRNHWEVALEPRHLEVIRNRSKVLGTEEGLNT